MSHESVLHLPTPALLVDLDRVEANLQRARSYADAQNVALRPHSKTHKSPEFARQQLDHGAVGICVAKLGEAEVMSAAGIEDIFMANTTFGEDKARRAVSLAQHARFSIGVDHPAQIDQLGEAARRASRPLRIRVEVDTGAGRGGAAPGDIGALLRRLRTEPGLLAEGLYTYEGYTYHAEDVAGLIEQHRRAQGVMASLAADNAELFDDVPIVSMGSTPSLLAEVELMDAITEIRPGTYVFLDAAQAALAGGAHHAAAHVLATVVSIHDGRAILDAGSKSLTSDSRAGGVTATAGYGLLVDEELTLTRLSEEHGVIEDPGVGRLKVGQKVRILPNHICPVVNLFPAMYLTRGELVERELTAACRGQLA